MLPDVQLTDGVVTLRPWRPSEADWYVRQVADPEVQRFTGEPADLDPVAVRVAIEDLLATRAHAGLAIADAITGELLGNAGLTVSAVPGVGDVSYWIAKPARGRGAATRAVRLLAEWAWQCGMHRIELYTHVDNLGSQRVAERAGFRRVAGCR